MEVEDGSQSSMAVEGVTAEPIEVAGPATKEAEAGVPRFSRLLPFAGPLLIIAAVLLVLHAYAFQGLISIKHPDLLPFWYPTWCYLGKSLAAGHIPAWNPHVMGGVPFAADPQSGWGYVPAMALFSALSCGAAVRWIIVFHPLVAGLALYAFLRSERLSRAAATVGGLAVALAISESAFVTYMPFAGMFAWTAVMLWTASRMLRASAWPSRLLWLVATSLAWGQLAAAHLSQGLVVGTGALVCFVAFRLGHEVRTKDRTPANVAGTAALFVASLPLVNLAFFLPRMAYLPETTLSRGYRSLQILRNDLAGLSMPRFLLGGNAPSFPLSLSASGGVYLGAVVLALAFAGWHARRLRPIWLAFVVYSIGAYVLSLHLVAKVVDADRQSSVIGSFYGHAVHRLSWGLVMTIPVLAAVGFDAWRERAGPAARLVMIGPAVLVWAVVPFVLGLHRQHPLLLAVGAIVALAALGLVAVRPAAVALIPLLVAAELSVNGLTLPTTPCCNDLLRPPGPPILAVFQPGDRPNVNADSYQRAGPIARALQSGQRGRYLGIDPAVLWATGERRALRNWPFMGTQRSMMFGLEEAQGYNPAQLMRYWTFLRAVQREPIVYNAAYFDQVEPPALNLLQVSYVIQSSADPPVVAGSTRVATEGAFALYAVPFALPRASLVDSWEIVGSADLARERILEPDFDPNVLAVLEKDPGLGPPRPDRSLNPLFGRAQYQAEGDQAAQILVDSSRPSLVLIRNVYERHWHASVDGRPAPLLAADSLIQAVPVSAGHHVVRVSYDDPTVGYGLLGSALALTALLAAAGILARRERRLRISP